MSAWFTSFTSRFTSDFIHERIWARLAADLEDDSDVVIIGQGGPPGRPSHQRCVRHAGQASQPGLVGCRHTDTGAS